MRITLVIASLNPGGAERVASSMANYWADSDWEITLLTMCGSGPPSFELHPKVIHHDLGVQPRSYSRPDQQDLNRLVDFLSGSSLAERSTFIADFNLIAALREAIINTRPEAVISFIDATNIRTLLATYGTRLPVIVSEHSDPYHNYLGPGWEGLRRRTYPLAKYVTVLTDEAATYFSTLVNGRLRVLPNSIPNAARPLEKETDTPHQTAPHVASASCRWERRWEHTTGGTPVPQTLLAMGRLAFEKGFDLLLAAFALLAKRQPAWRLQIYGEGPLRAELEHIAATLGLAERVQFPGFTKQPFAVMQQADLFVVPSRCEGFSNVLAEAMACGLPVVSFDCPSGPRHIIQNGIDGVLVPPENVSALAAALEQLMADEEERRRLAAAAPKVVERFGIERVMSMWSQLVVSAARNSDVEQ